MDSHAPWQPFVLKEARQEFLDHLQAHQPIPRGDTRAYGVTIKDDASIVEMKMEHPIRDAYKLAETFCPPIAMCTDITSLNFAGSQAVKDHFRSAKLPVLGAFQMEPNKRNHPVDRTNVYRGIGPGYGSNFTGKLPLQELSVLAQRYDNPKPKFPFNEDARKLAEKTVDEYFDRCKTSVLAQENWENMSDDLLDKIASEFCAQAATKGYDKQFFGFDYQDARVVRLHLKSIFKPDTSAKMFDVMKAGQGISAWSPDALSHFCFAFRIMQILDLLSNRNDEGCRVFNEHGKSEFEFITEVTTAIRELSNLPLQFGNTDGIMFDSNQNEFNQYQEFYYWKKLGASTLFLDHYYSFRHHYKLYGASGSTSTGEYEKTSGEPGTLINNEIVDKVNSSYLLDGVGPMIQVNKGDDYLKIQMALVANEAKKIELESYAPLKLRVTIKDEGEFCGFTISAMGFAPNVMRRVTKIIGCRWRDYAHFCEYQKSLRDYVRLIERTGVNTAVAGTMMNSRCSYDEAVYALYFVDSVSHLNEDQFMEMTKEFVEVPWHPVQDDHASLGMVFKY
jgi:hypothetical protein